jgi:hypothetical protein
MFIYFLRQDPATTFAWTGLKLMILLPLPPEPWDYRHELPHPAYLILQLLVCIGKETYLYSLNTIHSLIQLLLSVDYKLAGHL